MQEIIDQIITLKDEYDSMEEIIDHGILNNKDGSTEIDYSSVDFNPMTFPELMRIKKELTCLALDLARDVSFYNKAYENSEGKRKVEYFLRKREFMGPPKRLNGTQAEVAAEVEIKDLRIEMHTNKGLKESGKIFLNQANELLSSIKQDISVVRKNYESIIE